MTTVSLQPHPTTTAEPVRSFDVDIVQDNGRLTLRYVLRASPETLRMPPPGPAQRQDGLWKHSCFEAFLTEGAGPGYQEFNFSPSGAWAQYRFSNYRQALPDDPDVVPPDIRVQEEGDRFSLSAAILVPNSVTALGLSAVIEDSHGQLGYWAITHPAAEPDFHHPDARTVNLA